MNLTIGTRRLGHVNSKTFKKIVKGNLVRGLPSKIFQNDHTCVACQKGKQHKASCKAKSVSSISHSLQLLYMDLFGHTSVRSLNHKTYCLVITEAIRNRPPTKNQLRNQMMTYLKHVGNFKHAELKIKKFEEVQALYEKIKRSDEDFISIGSAEDERLIKRMNEKGVDSSKSEVLKEESKEEVQKESTKEESTRKRKLGTRKKIKSRKRRYIQNTSEDDSDKENDELRLHLTIAPDEEKEVDYEILDRKYPIKEWKTECLGTKPQTDQAEHIEEINQNVVIRSNGQKRYFSTLRRVLSIFDREDLNNVYQLVMDRFQDEIPEGFDRILWGDLMIMFNPDDENEFWNQQLDWNIVSWKLHSSLGVHTLVTEIGLVIHMLVEKKYPLRKEVMMKMLNLKLESEEDSTMALKLIKFVKKLLAELEAEE
ncbi:ribonuclease H-like domain-containing protein [Tanacetum coccineum]